MIATVRRLLALAGTPLPRVFLPALLGALAVVFGIGLMASSGYLISRAAEHPEVLALATTIVVVRFFGLARPIARYAERVSSHDLAFRVLATVRVRTYRRIEPLAPAQLRSDRQGDLLARVVGDVDALQDLHLRGLGPPLVAVAAGTVAVGAAWAILPAAALVLAIGLLVGGVAVPALAGALGPARGPARGRGARRSSRPSSSSSWRPRRSWSVYGREEEQVERLRRSDATLVRLARRAAIADGAADGLGLVVTGLTVTGVLALAVAAHADGQLDRVLVATLGLLALASFEAVQPLATAARELERTLAAGRRVLELTDREPAIVDPPEPLPAPVAPVRRGARGRARPLRPRAGAGARRLLAAPGAGAPGGPARPERRRQEHRRQPAPALPRPRGRPRHARRPRRSRVPPARRPRGRRRGGPGRPPVLDQHPRQPAPRAPGGVAAGAGGGAAPGAPRRLARHAAATASTPRVGERGGELSGGQRQRLVVARALLADAPVLVLDEPTAHLDAATATALMDDVMDAAGDRTVLLVTHRPEGLEHVDEVVVLEAPGAGSRS